MNGFMVFTITWGMKVVIFVWAMQKSHSTSSKTKNKNEIKKIVDEINRNKSNKISKGNC